MVRDRVAEPEYARNHLRRHGTLAEELRDHGYTTGAFCPNAYASRYYGFDSGFDTFEDFLFDTDLYQSVFEEHLGDSGAYTLFRNLRNYLRKQEAFKTWDTYVDDIVEWARAQSEPFFCWAFSLDTHFPYLTPRAYRRWGNLFEMYYYNWRCNELIDQSDIELAEREYQAIHDIYDDSIRFADQFVAELRDRLADFDPIFVVHADHGEAFGERNVYGHFYPSLYEENIHVPLVVSEGPDIETVEGPTSLLDLPDLLAGYADDPAYDPRSIASDWVVATDYDGRNDRDLTAIRTQNWKYLITKRDGETTRELYDLSERAVEGESCLGDGRSIEEPLGDLAELRQIHEAELLAIEDASGGMSA